MSFPLRKGGIERGSPPLEDYVRLFNNKLPMRDRPYKILLVVPNASMLETLVPALSERFDAHITCVSDAISCLDVEMLDPHDLVVSEMALPESNGLALAEQLIDLSGRPVILMADDPDFDDALQALRVGVADFFAHPFGMEEVLNAAQRALSTFTTERKRAIKNRRLRDLVRRVVRERRDLNQRMDLICRDLVESQRRLVHRVLAIEERRAQGTA